MLWQGRLTCFAGSLRLLSDGEQQQQSNDGLWQHSQELLQDVKF